MLASVSTSRLLGAAGGALSWTPTQANLGGSQFFPQYLTLHAGGSMVSAQTLTITIDDKDGENYDTLLYTESIAAGVVDKLYTFPTGLRTGGVESGSLIKVTLTATGSPEVTVYAKLFYRV